MSTVLDKNGLERLWEKIKKYVADNQGVATSANKLTNARTINGMEFDGTTATSNYVFCDTAASTRDKAVQINNFKVVNGARLIVRFTNGNSLQILNLVVNGGAGYPINFAYTVTSKYLQPGSVVEMVHSNGIWTIIGEYTQSQIGTLSDLKTSAKTSLVSAVNELNTKITEPYEVSTTTFSFISFTCNLILYSNGMKSIRYNGSWPTTVANGTNVNNTNIIPAAYRPTGTNVYLCVPYASATAGQIFIQLSKDGNSYFCPRGRQINAGEWITFQTFYI